MRGREKGYLLMKETKNEYGDGEGERISTVEGEGEGYLLRRGREKDYLL